MATAFETLAPVRPDDWRRAAPTLQSDKLYRFAKLHEVRARSNVEHAEGPPLDAPLHTDRELFKARFEQWLEDSMLDSLPNAMRAHESYQQIVSMGERVVPLIAAELRRSPGFIFLALEDITGADPVDEASMGNLRATTDAWLKWLRS